MPTGPRFKLGLVFCLVILSITLPAQNIRVVLRPEPVNDPKKGLAGISNLFFSKAGSDNDMQFPEQWKEIETDMIVRNANVKPLPVFRIKESSGEYAYYADLDNNKKIEASDRLVFNAVKDYQIADFALVPQSLSGKNLAPVSFQLVLADNYVYGRIKEQRTGTMTAANHSHMIVMRPASRNAIGYSKNGSRFFLDLNSDKTIDEQWRVDNGAIISSEEINPSDPFKLNGESYIIDSIDAEGNWVEIRPFTSKEALGQGFQFPALKLTAMDGNSIDLSRSRYSIIEMWSVSCHFCEMVRPKLNALKAEMGEGINWIAIGREGKPAIDEFLPAHPMDSKIVVPSKEQWAYLNPATATPLFYLVDSNGTIVLKGAGANIFPVIEAIVRAGK